MHHTVIAGKRFAYGKLGEAHFRKAKAHDPQSPRFRRTLQSLGYLDGIAGQARNDGSGL